MAEGHTASFITTVTWTCSQNGYVSDSYDSMADRLDNHDIIYDDTSTACANC